MGKVKISYDEAVKLGLTKECSMCHEVKSVAEFNRGKKGKYGAGSICKECKGKYNKQYNQEHKEEKANHQRKYYQEHKEEMAKYYQEHREEKANYQKQYNQTLQGKETGRKADQKRRALKNNSFYQPFTQEDKEFCLNYFNHKCPYKGKPLTDSVHIDHIVPFSDKNGVGATAPWNLIVCDASTNMSKQNKPVLEFINSLPNPDEVYNKIRGYIMLQAKRYIDIIPEDDITLKTFNISFKELED